LPKKNVEIARVLWEAKNAFFPHALTLLAACGTMNLVGRLAQRLERSVYTRKVVRSNRTVPTIVTINLSPAQRYESTQSKKLNP
jgi:hypothetical protein